MYVAQPNQIKIGIIYKNQKKTYVSQGCRKLKIFGGTSSKRWAKPVPLVEIGLTDAPKIKGRPGRGPPASRFRHQPYLLMTVQ